MQRRTRIRVLWSLGAVVAVVAIALGGMVVLGHDEGDRTTDLSAGDSIANSMAEAGDAADSTSTTVELVPVTGAPRPSTATATPAPPATPARQSATATAPVFMSAVADAIAGIVTITFDQPVDVAQAMNLMVFSTDATCGTPQGNAHELLAGGGTRTITLEASSFVPGTNFIRVGPGFVVGTRGKLPNEPVGCTAVSGGPPAAPRYKKVAVDAGAGTVTVTFDQAVEPGDAAKLVVFSGDDGSCGTPRATATSVTADHDRRAVVANVTGLTAGVLHLRIGEGLVIGTHGFIANEPEPCVRAEGVVPPLLRYARATQVGDVSGGTTLVLTFDQPVRAANVDMSVIVYDDSGCDGPNGNSHGLLGGDGTDTITVNVTGYQPGTTNYLRISPGFVTAVDDGTPNTVVPCTVVTTS